MQASSIQDPLTRRVAFLKQVPLFAPLTHDQLRLIAGDFRQRSYEKGATLFRQGDRSSDMYVIYEGRVRIFRLSRAGNETSVQLYSVGAVMGELAAIDGLPRSASAKAIGPCVLLEMEGKQFANRMRDIPDLAIAMTRLLAGKLRWTTDYAETIAQYNAAGRLLHILLSYTNQFGHELEAGRRYELTLNLNQTDLASLVGARREWVNRILQDWHKLGLIEYRAGTIVILDLPRVVQLRDSSLEASQHRTEG